jgi:hypothetical protein
MALDTALPARWAGGLFLGLVGLILIVVIAATQSVSLRDRSTVAIRSVRTGKYLELSPEDGLLHLTANSSTSKATQFRLIKLTAGTVELLRPKPVSKTATRLGCPCSGLSDWHGFGRHCHNWESEHHRPWCYVADSCKHGQRGRKQHKHQACSSEEGYLGPEGWKAAEGCPCNGHESIHGFGAFCKGWEFAGQTPWCYTDDTCESAVGDVPGSKYHECVSNTTSPSPPPPSPSPNPPPPPSPPSPPPNPVIISHDGWGTPANCPCSGYSNKHGFGAFCKGWEVEGQVPWCYVHHNCTAPVVGGTFKHPFLQCTKAPNRSSLFSFMGRMLSGGPPEHRPATKATFHAPMIDGSKLAGGVKKQHDNKQAPEHKDHKKAAHGKPHTRAAKKALTFEEEQAVLLKRTKRLPHFAFVSQVSQGYLAVDAPPKKEALFARGDTETLSLQAVFAIDLAQGALISIGTGAVLNLCERADQEGLTACTGTAKVHHPRHTLKAGSSQTHHRKLLLRPEEKFVVETVKA